MGFRGLFIFALLVNVACAPARWSGVDLPDDPAERERIYTAFKQLSNDCVEIRGANLEFRSDERCRKDSPLQPLNSRLARLFAPRPFSVRARVVPEPVTVVDDNGQRARIGKQPSASPGLTGVFSGGITIVVYGGDRGLLPGHLVEDGRSADSPFEVVLAHELGHAFFEVLQQRREGGGGSRCTDESALDFENAARRLFDAKAPLRISHSGGPICQ